MKDCTANYGKYHAWFELKKLESIEAGEPYKQGILIQCADCEVRKELWE